MTVSTNTYLLKEDYMMDNKPKSKVVLDELRGEDIVSSVPKTQVESPRVASTQERGELVVESCSSTRSFHWSGRDPRGA